MTFRKYVEVAERMRKENDYSLDIRNYEPQEVHFIATLVKNDGVFNFAKETQDIDVRKIKYAMLMLEAEEKYKACIGGSR